MRRRYKRSRTVVNVREIMVYESRGMLWWRRWVLVGIYRRTDNRTPHGIK